MGRRNNKSGLGPGETNWKAGLKKNKLEEGGSEGGSAFHSVKTFLFSYFTVFKDQLIPLANIFAHHFQCIKVTIFHSVIRKQKEIKGKNGKYKIADFLNLK